MTLLKLMKSDEFPVQKNHGKMSETEERSTCGFKSGSCRVLIF